VARLVMGLGPGNNINAFLNPPPGYLDELKRGAMRASEAPSSEAAAVGALRTLNTAEVTYSSTYPHGFSPDLKSLGDNGGVGSESAAALIDAELAGGKKNGYIFVYTSSPKDAKGLIQSYSIKARPATFGKTGSHNYYSDQSGVIRATDQDRAATVGDPPLQ